MRVFELCALLGLIAVLAAACHKARVAAPSVPAAPSAEAPAPPGPPTCTLTAEPATVTMGQSATLTWTSENASGLTLQPKLGTQQAEGSISVTPTDSTTYTLSLTGAAGSGECDARVTVTPGTPPAPSVEESTLPPSAAGAAGAKLQDAFFDFNKADLRPDAQSALTQDANFLKSHSAIKVRISGHCDQRGSEEYNLGLGQRRAEAAERFLVTLGVPAANISAVSYGKDRLFCTEETEDCYQQNRRAHLKMLNQ